MFPDLIVSFFLFAGLGRRKWTGEGQAGDQVIYSSQEEK